MSDLDAPIWSFPPSWGEGPMVETYSFLTNVMVDKLKGTEQRQGMRRTPRRMLEGTYTVLADERTELDLALQAVGDGRWRVPLWPQAVLTGLLERGDLSIDSDFRGRDVYPGTQLLVLGGNAHDYEVVTVGSLDARGYAQLTSNLTQRWPTATVAPLRAGELTEQPQVTRINSYALRAQARFRFVGANPHTPAAPTLVYQGLPVLLGRTNDDSAGVSLGFSRFSYRVDGGTGGVYTMDTAGRGVYTQTHLLSVQGPYAYTRLRDLIYTLQGQLNLVWLPTFADDFKLAQGAKVGDSTIVVNYVGYSVYGVGNPDRANLYVELCSGERMLFPILNAAASGNKQTETLALGGVVTTAFEPQDVYVCCFMARVRSAEDDLEVTCAAGIDGNTTLALSLRTEPDLRVGPAGLSSIGEQDIPVLYVPASTDTGQYTVGWSRINSAHHYVLEERVQGAPDWTTVLTGPSRSYYVGNKPQGVYEYRVSACDTTHCTAPSDPQSINVIDLFLHTPAVPSGLRAIASGNEVDQPKHVYAWWGTVRGALSYELEQTHPQAGISVVYSGSDASYTFDVQATGNLSYRVRACNSTGCSVWSASVLLDITEPPAGSQPGDGKGGMIYDSIPG